MDWKKIRRIESHLRNKISFRIPHIRKVLKRFFAKKSKKLSFFSFFFILQKTFRTPHARKVVKKLPQSIHYIPGMYCIYWTEVYSKLDAPWNWTQKNKTGKKSRKSQKSPRDVENEKRKAKTKTKTVYTLYGKGREIFHITQTDRKKTQGKENLQEKR